VAIIKNGTELPYLKPPVAMIIASYPNVMVAIEVSTAGTIIQVIRTHPTGFFYRTTGYPRLGAVLISISSG
jgi:hypothetical protein